MELLPARDAGRTCVLSSKWRYVWANHPSLVLDCDFWYRSIDELDKDYSNIFRSMVLLHVGHIRRLEFFVPFKGFTPHFKIDSWLSHLCRKGLKDLVLYLHGFDNLYRIPCFVFSTSTLTHLFLGYCIIKGNDNSVCLTNIQSLNLEHVTLDSCVLTTPLLTFLRVRNCSFNLDFHIFAPKLASLKYYQNESYMNLIPFSSCTGIEDLCIFSLFSCLNKNITHFADGESRINFVNMLAAWPRISKLEIDGCFVKYLATDSIPWILQPNNLTSIRLFNFYVDSRLIPWILCILKNSPLLHTFEISISASSMEEVIDIDETLIMELNMEQLRTIKMINFKALRNEVMFAEILLKCAPSLEKMLVADCYGLHPNERINILKKLLLLQRSFSKPQIVSGRF